jgi:hypothetical protein
MEKQKSKLDRSEEEASLLDGEYVVVTNKKLGLLFIEARIRDDVEEEMNTAMVVHKAQHSVTLY